MTEQQITLLVRADDLGFSHAANLACIEVFKNGICRSVELMAPCPWFPEAVSLLRANPSYDVGVHLTLTSEWDGFKWGPITDAQSIVTDDGYFYPRYRKRDDFPDEGVFEDCAWTPEDVETEYRAQIERVRKHVPWVSHMSYHMGYLRDDEVFSEIVSRLAQEYDLAIDPRTEGFERFRGFGEDSQKLTSQEKVETLRASLTSLAPGRWMFVDHPAYDCAEMRGVHHTGYENVAEDRQGVVDAWTSSEIVKIVADRNIHLVSYGDIRRGVLG